MKKNTYIAPQLRIVEMNIQGIIASSDRIPVDPTPSTPATNKFDSPWNSKQWEASSEE